MKVCKYCNKNKNLEEFSKQPKPRQDYKPYCKVCCSLKAKKWKNQNEQKFIEYQKTYDDSGKTARQAKRHASKLQATPVWLTKKHLEEIKEVYKRARYLTKITGEQHHVDHIVPLQGLEVRGLHVPWNLQVLKAKDNLSKGRKCGGSEGIRTLDDGVLEAPALDQTKLQNH